MKLLSKNVPFKCKVEHILPFYLYNINVTCRYFICYFHAHYSAKTPTLCLKNLGKFIHKIPIWLRQESTNGSSSFNIEHRIRNSNITPIATYRTAICQLSARGPSLQTTAVCNQTSNNELTTVTVYSIKMPWWR